MSETDRARRLSKEPEPCSLHGQVFPRAAVKLLQLPVLEPMPGPNPVLAAFPSLGRSSLLVPCSLSAPKKLCCTIAENRFLDTNHVTVSVSESHMMF